MASYKELVAQREALDRQIEETRLAESKAAIAQADSASRTPKPTATGTRDCLRNAATRLAISSVCRRAAPVTPANDT